MALYQFYCWTPDGASSAFHVCELGSDSEARSFAARLLEEHPSCERITVLRHEDELFECRRCDCAELAPWAEG